MSKDKSYSTPLIIYDSKCTLCNRFKQTFEKLKGSEKFSFVSIHDEEIYQQFTSLDKEKCFEEIHIIESDGLIYRGAEAIKHLISIMPATSGFAWLIEKDMSKKSIDLFYKVASKYRKKLLEKCNNKNCD